MTNIKKVTNKINNKIIVALIIMGVFVVSCMVYAIVQDSYEISTWALLAALMISFFFWGYINIKEGEISKTWEEKSIENELNLLKSQLNPHFIFNTLNSLMLMLEQERNADAILYFEKFSKMLRNFLVYSSKPFISLKEEIESLDTFREFENLRFKDKFKFEIVVDENIDIENVKITPMILQPIVENAINHGLKDRISGGLLVVNIAKNGDCLKCTIADNGIGVENAIKKKEASGNKNVAKGSSLVIDRLNLLNEQHNLKVNKFYISSKPATHDTQYPGTIVEISIPSIF